MYFYIVLFYAGSIIGICQYQVIDYAACFAALLTCSLLHSNNQTFQPNNKKNLFSHFSLKTIKYIMEIVQNDMAQHTQNEKKHGEQNQVAAFVATIWRCLMQDYMLTVQQFIGFLLVINSPAPVTQTGLKMNAFLLLTLPSLRVYYSCK